jgi:hypothetical protein
MSASGALGAVARPAAGIGSGLERRRTGLEFEQAPARQDGSLAPVLFGTHEAAPEPLALRAGPLTLTYRAGKLLHLRVGDVEVWHAVVFPFRDPDWGTPEPVLVSLDHDSRADGFHLRFAGFFPTSPAIELRVEIEGTDEGCVRFAGEAIPAGDVPTNRLGVCVLHPLSAAGAAIEVEHVDGRLSRSTVPTLIPPWPPFTLVRAIRHEYAPGCWARCELQGDTFEFEDQRNNSDASFKTYSRSNLMPRPYVLRAGIPVRQSAELRVESAPAKPRPSRRADPVVVRAGGEVRALPRVGIEIAAGDVGAPRPVREALRELKPAALHLALDGDSGGVDWAGLRTLLAETGADLRLDLVSADAGSQRDLIGALGRTLGATGLVPESVAVFPSEQESIEAARATFPGSRIGGGTPHYFAQLNRLERLGPVDFVSFTTSPLVHGADDDLVMLSLQSLPSMIDTARALHLGLPVRVGPSGIGVRRSPLGGQPATDGLSRVALAKRDPRSRGLFGAAWALGYLAQLAQAGAEAVTLMSLTGDAGVVEPAPDGTLMRFPAHALLARLGGLKRMGAAAVSDPSRIAALALVRAGGIELLCANLTSRPVEVALEGWADPARVAVMDAESWGGFGSEANGWEAARRPASARSCRLSPYAIASIELGGGAR